MTNLRKAAIDVVEAARALPDWLFELTMESEDEEAVRAFFEAVGTLREELTSP